MDRNKIITVLKNVTDERGELFLASKTRTLGLSSDSTESFLNHFLSEPVKKALIAQEEFRDGRSYLINLDNGQSGFYPDLVATRMVAKTRASGSALVAVEWLEKILSTKKASGICVMALQGISVNTSVNLYPQIDLMPVSQLPDSSQKNNFLKLQIPSASPWPIPNPALFDAPKSALVYRKVIDPFMVDSLHEEPPQGPNLREYHLLDKVRLALTCVGPCAPMQIAYWFQFEDKDLEEALLGPASLHRHHEILPLHLKEYGVFDPEMAKVITRSFLQLREGKLKNRIHVALERLHQSMLRHDAGDMAMDTSIALEALLADGSGENTFKVALRAALLLGGDVDQRLQNRATVAGAYVLRSAVVHNGKSGNTVKLAKFGEKDSLDVAANAITICAAVIRHLLETGDAPDWYTIELLGGKKTHAA
jgi:hypothetical protein